MAKKIPGTEASGPGTWPDLERYARAVADEPLYGADLALQLIELAAAEIRRESGAWVSVFAYDGRPAYLGTVRATRPTRGRYEVYNPETTETVAVPVSSLAPYGAEFNCDCPSCLGVWLAAGLQ